MSMTVPDDRAVVDMPHLAMTGFVAWVERKRHPTAQSTVVLEDVQPSRLRPADALHRLEIVAADVDRAHIRCQRHRFRWLHDHFEGESGGPPLKPERRRITRDRRKRPRE